MNDFDESTCLAGDDSGEVVPERVGRGEDTGLGVRQAGRFDAWVDELRGVASAELAAVWQSAAHRMIVSAVVRGGGRAVVDDGHASGPDAIG